MCQATMESASATLQRRTRCLGAVKRGRKCSPAWPGRSLTAFYCAQNKDMDWYKGVGQAPGLAKQLGCSVETGLNPDASATGLDSVSEHRRVFGANKYAEVPPKLVSRQCRGNWTCGARPLAGFGRLTSKRFCPTQFICLVWEVLQDPILILLCVAAAVSLEQRQLSSQARGAEALDLT